MSCNAGIHLEGRGGLTAVRFSSISREGLIYMRKSLGKLIRASSQMYEILWGNRLRITKDDNLFAFEPLGDRIQINSPFLITGLNNIIYNDLGATPMLKRSKTGTQLVDDKSTSCVPVLFPPTVWMPAIKTRQTR